MARAASPTPSRSKQWKALGPSWMPAPISPSCAAFSSTSEAMPFWASASAAARPPMPPPAMRTGLSVMKSCHPEQSEGPLRPQERSLAALGMTTLVWSRNDSLIMELGDLMVGQPEDTRQDLVGMLAEQGRRLRRLARGRAELQRRGGDRI